MVKTYEEVRKTVDKFCKEYKPSSQWYSCIGVLFTLEKRVAETDLCEGESMDDCAIIVYLKKRPVGVKLPQDFYEDCRIFYQRMGQIRPAGGKEYGIDGE